MNNELVHLNDNNDVKHNTLIMNNKLVHLDENNDVQHNT